MSTGPCSVWQYTKKIKRASAEKHMQGGNKEPSKHDEGEVDIREGKW